MRPYKKDLTDHGTRVWVLMNVFNRADICAEAMEQAYKTRWLGGAGWTHVWLNQHYPVRKRSNTKKMRDLCVEYGGLWMDAGRNIGLHEGLKYMFNRLPIADTDYILMLDPDNYPTNPGWDDALVRVLHYDPKIGQATLWQPAVRDHEKNINWGPERIVDGIKVRVCNQAFVRTVTCWRAGDIRKVGQWDEPCAFWGHLESVMTQRFTSRGFQDVYLPDFFESSAPSHRIDPEYQQYKVAHAHHRTWTGDLESYLRHLGKGHLIDS